MSEPTKDLPEPIDEGIIEIDEHGNVHKPKSMILAAQAPAMLKLLKRIDLIADVFDKADPDLIIAWHEFVKDVNTFLEGVDE